jgi:hypothetical protein
VGARALSPHTLELGIGSFRFITGKGAHEVYDISTPTAVLDFAHGRRRDTEKHRGNSAASWRAHRAKHIPVQTSALTGAGTGFAAAT